MLLLFGFAEASNCSDVAMLVTGLFRRAVYWSGSAVEKILRRW